MDWDEFVIVVLGISRSARNDLIRDKHFARGCVENTTGWVFLGKLDTIIKRFTNCVKIGKREYRLLRLRCHSPIGGIGGEDVYQKVGDMGNIVTSRAGICFW